MKQFAAVPGTLGVRRDGRLVCPWPIGKGRDPPSPPAPPPAPHPPPCRPRQQSSAPWTAATGTPSASIPRPGGGGVGVFRHGGLRARPRLGDLGLGRERPRRGAGAGGRGGRRLGRAARPGSRPWRCAASAPGQQLGGQHSAPLRKKLPEPPGAAVLCARQATCEWCPPHFQACSHLVVPRGHVVTRQLKALICEVLDLMARGGAPARLKRARPAPQHSRPEPGRRPRPSQKGASAGAGAGIGPGDGHPRTHHLVRARRLGLRPSNPGPARPSPHQPSPARPGPAQPPAHRFVVQQHVCGAALALVVQGVHNLAHLRVGGGGWRAGDQRGARGGGGRGARAAGGGRVARAAPQKQAAAGRTRGRGPGPGAPRLGQRAKMCALLVGQRGRARPVVCSSPAPIWPSPESLHPRPPACHKGAAAAAPEPQPPASPGRAAL
jgi:hypothetical protein